MGSTPAGAVILKTRGFIDLLRPELPIAAGICVVAGELLGGGRIPTLGEAFLGFLIGFLVSSSEMTVNDYFDIDVDKVNHPERPLPSGRIKPWEAAFFAVLLTIAGLAASLLWSLTVLGLASLVWVVGILYNWRYKETGLPGNLMVSFSVAMTFVLGGVAATGFPNGVVLSFGASAFLFDLSEEISASAMDAAGDELRSVKSWARTRGKDYALRVSAVLLAVFILLTFVPFVMGWLGIAYLILASVADLSVVVLAALLLKSETIEEGRTRIRQLYIALTFFVVAIIASQLLSA